MPQFAVSLTRTVHERTILYVHGEDEAEAEAAARNEVRLGAGTFTRLPGSAEVTIDWIAREEPS